MDQLRTPNIGQDLPSNSSIIGSLKSIGATKDPTKKTKEDDQNLIYIQRNRILNLENEIKQMKTVIDNIGQIGTNQYNPAEQNQNNTPYNSTRNSQSISNHHSCDCKNEPYQNT